MSETKPRSKQTTWRLRAGERRSLILVGDFILTWIAWAFAIWGWATAEQNALPLMEFITARLQGWFFLLPIIWLVLLVDSYDPRTSTDLNKTVRAIAVSVLIGGFIYLVVYFASDATLPRRGVAIFIGASALLTLIWRFIYIQIFSGERFMHNVLLVGAGETGSALVEVLNLEDVQPPYKLIGLVDDDPIKQGQDIEGYKVIGSSEQILILAETNQVSEIIVAISGRMLPNTFQTLLEAQERGIHITRMPVAYEELLQRVPVQNLEADWILRSFVDESRVSAFFSMAKRFIDILGGLVGVLSLVVLGPLISLAILIESGRPIVFHQTRAGKGGVPFNILKFRTMWQHDEDGNLAPIPTQENDQRVTPMGRILRKTHLDEWLQFVNVLRGDMSLVGPRPELPQLMEHFQKHLPFYRARLLVRPGIAGWAQVHLNYASTMEETRIKLEYDLYYIKHRSIWMDVGILLRTFAAVFGFRGR